MKYVSIVIIVLSLSGCASTNMHEKNSGHVFMGIRASVHGVKCVWVSTVHEADNTPWYLWSPIALAVTFIYFAALPLEFIADMAYLPKDIDAEPTDLETDLPSNCGFTNYSGNNSRETR